MRRFVFLVLFAMPTAAIAQQTNLQRNPVQRVPMQRLPAQTEANSVPIPVQYGPSNSLYQNANAVRSGAMTEQASWTYVPPPVSRQLRVNDLISIRVQEGAQLISEGESQTRRTGNYSAVLLDWLKFSSLDTVKPDAQTDGDPTVAGTVNTTMRAQGEVESRESLTFNISARVVDIRPNGNLIVEARREIQNNQEVWEYYLTGECRPKDVDEFNLILSRDIADLRIEKRERGEVRDGYRRGWLSRFIGRWRLF